MLTHIIDTNPQYMLFVIKRWLSPILELTSVVHNLFTGGLLQDFYFAEHKGVPYFLQN